MAAWLALGPRSAVSHSSAAALWQLEVPVPVVPELTVTSSRHPRRSSIRVHRVRTLGRGDVVTLHGLRATSPIRTLIDIAGVIDETMLERAHDSLWRRRLVTPERLLQKLSTPSCGPLVGTNVLRRLAADRCGRRATDSDLESRYFALLRRYKVPLPKQQFDVMTPSGLRRLDYAYPDSMIAIELDGFTERFANRGRFDDDRARQNDLEALGWRFRRFTDTHITADPLSVVIRTADAAGLKPIKWRSTP